MGCVRPRRTKCLLFRYEFQVIEAGRRYTVAASFHSTLHPFKLGLRALASPNGRHIAYIVGHMLYVYDLP